MAWAKFMFRYFCGVCWKRIERLQSIAADLIAKEGA
jgi:hypothetical protein